MKTLENQVNENYRSKSKLSNYDSCATTIIDGKKNPFKASLMHSEQKDSQRVAQSKVLMRAARSITKTKSVSGDGGSFILKTKISKSTEKTGNITQIE